MLYLVGIGMDKEDISLAGIRACKDSEAVYVDRYTSYVNDERLVFLEETIGKEIQELRRADLEESLPALLEKGKRYNIAILVGGDPLMATTHKIIFTDAKEMGVDVKVIHAASGVIALIGESGLDFYRFGQICTISKWAKHYSPVSFYETIQRNAKNNLHSLILLDYEPGINSSLEMKEAIRILEEAEQQYKGNVIAENTTVLVMHKMGLPGMQKMISSIKQAKMLTFGHGPTSIIIPAKLTDIEKEVMGSMF